VLDATRRRAPTDWEIWHERRFGAAEPNLVVRRSPDLALYHWAFDDGTEFLISSDGSQVEISWQESESIDCALTYLLGPAMGFVLQLRGVACLHASAVANAGWAVVLAGHSGAGKSTSTGALLRQGWSLVTDDLVAFTPTQSALFVEPGYPRLRLWPAAARLLHEMPVDLPRLVPKSARWIDWDKRFIELSAGKDFSGERQAVAAVYVLSARLGGGQRPRIEALQGREAVTALVAASHQGDLPLPSIRAAELDLFACLARARRVRRLCVPEGMEGLRRLSGAIDEDLRSSGLAPNVVVPAA
jgi:hypothetical protein